MTGFTIYLTFEPDVPGAEAWCAVITRTEGGGIVETIVGPSAYDVLRDAAITTDKLTIAVPA